MNASRVGWLSSNPNKCNSKGNVAESIVRFDIKNNDARKGGLRDSAIASLAR